MRKFKIVVRTNKIGSDCSMVVELDDEDVPGDWETSSNFSREMFDELSDSGLFSWDFQEIKQ